MSRNWNYISFVHLIFLLSIVSGVRAQDIHFSQFNEAPLLLNPATAGTGVSDFRFALNYRNQWKNVIAPFKTIAISFDSRLKTGKKKNGNYFGYGFCLFNDKSGLSRLTTNQVNIDLGYHLMINRKSSIGAGINAGFFQRILTTSGLKWDAQYNGKEYDASMPTQENAIYQSFMKFDLGAGLLYKFADRSSGNKFEIGFAMAHLTRPKISFYQSDPSLNLKYTGHTSFQAKIGEESFLVPSALFTMQGKHTEMVFGGAYKVITGQQTRDKVLLNTFTLFSSSFSFGAYYRVKDALIFTASLEYLRNMSLGISYDVNISQLNSASKRRGGLELSLLFTGIGGSTKGNKNDR